MPGACMYLENWATVRENRGFLPTYSHEPPPPIFPILISKTIPNLELETPTAFFTEPPSVVMVRVRALEYCCSKSTIVCQSCSFELDPRVFCKYFYNPAHRLRLEKLLYLERPRSSNGFFKVLQDPGGGFTSETAARRFQK
jgi:hypothetical protein